jgi:hypothetical protein
MSRARVAFYGTEAPPSGTRETVIPQPKRYADTPSSPDTSVDTVKARYDATTSLAQSRVLTDRVPLGTQKLVVAGAALAAVFATLIYFDRKRRA